MQVEIFLSVKIDENEPVAIGVGQKIIWKPGTGTIVKLGSSNELSNAEYSFDLTSGIWSNNVFGNSTDLFAVNQSIIKSSSSRRPNLGFSEVPLASPPLG